MTTRNDTPDFRGLRVLVLESRRSAEVAALIATYNGQSLLAPALRARGVSRLCPLGRMQRPRLSWPRGQHPPLGVLLGRRGDPELEVEA